MADGDNKQPDREQGGTDLHMTVSSEGGASRLIFATRNGGQVVGEITVRAVSWDLAQRLLDAAKDHAIEQARVARFAVPQGNFGPPGRARRV